MRQLTDEEIRKMSPKEAEVYLESYPDEAWHFAKVFYASANGQAKKAVRHFCGGANST